MFNAITGVVSAAGDAARYAAACLPSGSVSFRVQPERVYELANRFDEVADRIEGGVGVEIMSLVVEPPGVDQPSLDAVDRLTETGFGVAGLVTRLDAYVAELRNVAASLRQVGQRYGLTDDTESGRLSAQGL